MGWRACAAVLTCLVSGWACAQDLPPSGSTAAHSAATPNEAPPAQREQTGHPAQLMMIPLVVPPGTPLQIALDEEIRVKNAGQVVHGKVMEPVYAFDRVVIPAGAEVSGHITNLEDISAGKRTLSALDANFTPDHKVTLEFEELDLGDGRHMALHTVVTPGTGRLLEFVQARESKKTYKEQASEKIAEAKRQAKEKWDNAVKQVTEPGRMHRLERYIYSQLPVHPHYLDAGTQYTAELEEPLNFGSAPLTTKMVEMIGHKPPLGSVVHARLLTPLNSSRTQVGDPIEAILSQPLFDGDRLILPTGSSLKGVVLQARPAHKLKHNGQLRIVFHELKVPEGLEQRVTAVPVGVAAAKVEHLALDSEGGAEATSPKTRYFHTALAVGLAATSSGSDSDARDGGGEAGGNTSNRVAGGAGGFKLVGILVGAFVHSQPLGEAMGALGAGRSLYANFLGQGHEVIFPKNTPMEVSVGGTPAPPLCGSVTSESSSAQQGAVTACAIKLVRVF